MNKEKRNYLIWLALFLMINAIIIFLNINIWVLTSLTTLLFALTIEMYIMRRLQIKISDSKFLSNSLIIWTILNIMLMFYFWIANK